MPASLIHSSALSQNGRASDMWRSCFNVWVLFQDTLIAMTWCTFTSIIFLSMSLHVINSSQWRKNWQIVYPLTLSDPTRISSHKSIASPGHLAFIQLLSNHHWYSPATSDPIHQNSNWASHLSHLLHCSPAEIWALVLPWDFAIQQAVTLGCLSLLNICRPQNTLTVGAGWWRSLDNSKLGSKHIFIGCGKPLSPAIDNTSSTWNISILSQDTCDTLYVTANSTYSKTETFENTDIFSTVLQRIEPFNASCCLRTTSLHQTFQPVSHVTLCDTKPPNRMSTPWKMEDNGRHAEYCKIAWHLQVPNSLIRPMDHLALLVLQSGSWEACLMKASPETSPWGSPITVAWNETPPASDSMWQWCFCMFLGMFLLSNLFRLTQEHQELYILSWICEHKSSVCGDRSPTKNGAVSA